ncbi:hypothetical protein H8356DRAFT_1713665 [Neocallimastix lanati (nom. inval.)]|nr:hypothetical protein H8356DRAFT_1713665 [Neocallimastix sp. JGI-2020a]
MLIIDTNSTHYLRENLKVLFEQDEDVALQEWINALKVLKVCQRKIPDITNKIMTIFKQINNKKFTNH